MSIGSTGISRLLALALLGGIAVQSRQIVSKDPAVLRYHARIHSTAAQLPMRFGLWIGQDVKMPAQAMTVLQPNVAISRMYVNVQTGVQAGLLLVQCTDAHHMVGHFPLRCYPAEGWTLDSSRPRDWQIGNLHLIGMEYAFSRAKIGDPFAEPDRLIVDNILFRPNGQILRDMSSMSDSIVGAEGQATGAGQIQVYYEPNVAPADRDAAFAALVGGCRPVIDAILSDPHAR